MKLFTERSSHWYSRAGDPCHTVPARSGELRPTNVRDARKLGLLPSVTNVLGVLNKPELGQWKMEQAVLAALTLPRREGEDLDGFAQRVVEDSQSRMQSAMDFGTAFHAGAERIAKSLEVDPADPLAEWLNHYRFWFQTNCARVIWTERVLVNDGLGYAGTADLLIEHQAHGLTLVDIKTQGIKDGADGTALKPRAYSSWGYQLAAYRATLGQKMRCLNLVVNSNRAEPPVEHLWLEDELGNAEQAFLAAHFLWCAEKGYWPQRVEGGRLCAGGHRVEGVEHWRN